MDTTTNRSSDETTSSPKRGMRLWIPAIIVAVAAANIIRLQTMPELDALAKAFWSLLSALGAVPFLLIWWLFLSRLRWRARLVGAVVAVICVVGWEVSCGSMVRWEPGGR